MCKEDESLQLSCDYLVFNAKTYPDRHLLPNIQDNMDSLGRNVFFGVLDQSKAYYQLHMNKESRYLTAFITPWGLYEWERVPLGLMLAPAVFQRFMENCLVDYRDPLVAPHIDGVLVYSKSFEDHVNHLQQILQQFREKRMK